MSPMHSQDSNPMHVQLHIWEEINLLMGKQVKRNPCNHIWQFDLKYYQLDPSIHLELASAPISFS